jgi:hypothetical protein
MSAASTIDLRTLLFMASLVSVVLKILESAAHARTL